MFWEIVKSDFSWLMKENKSRNVIDMFDEKDYYFDTEKRNNRANILICDSFYSFFISAFSEIRLFRFRSNVKFDETNYQSYHIELFNEPSYLKGTSLLSIKELSEDVDFSSFYKFLMSSNSIPQSFLTTSRGNAFFIPDSSVLDNDRLIQNGFNFEFHNFGVFGSKDIIKYILIQYETRSYGLLTLKNTSEENFEPDKHLFSFAINYFKDRVHEGDIYFFSSQGLKYAKKNVVKIINSYLLKNTKSERPNNFSLNTSFSILEYPHQFNEYDERTKITFFKESEFVYTIKMNEKLLVGSNREGWAGVTARINFYNDEILEFNGSKSVETLK